MLRLHRDREEIEEAIKDGRAIDKRVYVPGHILESKCPKCHTVATLDLYHEYVTQYPVSGRAYEVTFACESEGCRTEWTAGKVKYVLTVEIAE